METTLCYLEQDGKYLMLYRNRKAPEEDINYGKWVGIGGKIEDGETPEACVCREVFEETGLTLSEYRYRGVVDFRSDTDGCERMHLFTATAWTGEMHDCDEGELRWVKKKNLEHYPIWEGDTVFLRELDRTDRFFRLRLTYQGQKLVNTHMSWE